MHSSVDAAPRPAVAPGLVLAAAVLGMSVAAPLVRLSAASPAVIALWRMGISLLIVAAGLAATSQWRELLTVRSREVVLSVMAGVALAGHFWSWNASVHLTTIAASVTLVSLQPAVVVLLSAVFLRESPTARQLAGIAVALTGALLISLPDVLRDAGAGAGSAGSANATLGNILALIGAVLAAIYFVLGRTVRSRLGVWSYVAIAYTACFVALLLTALVLPQPIWPQPPRELLIFAGLALGPMLLAHTGMNWALRYRPAYVVNLTVLAEPFGASLIAAFLPWIAEVPPATTIAGGIIVIAGMVLAAHRR